VNRPWMMIIRRVTIEGGSIRSRCRGGQGGQARSDSERAGVIFDAHEIEN
jgi:hypothetical protein